MPSATAKTELSTQSRIASIGKLNYLDFFGFKAPPFKNSSEIASIYLNDAIQTSLAEIEAAIARADGGVLVVNGTPGSGKTTLVGHAVDRHADEYRSAKLSRTVLADTDFLQMLLHGFGLDPEGLDRSLMIDSFLELVEEESAQGKGVILVVDEAQNLSPSVLKLLPKLILSDASSQTSARRRVFIVLVGQDGFDRTLAHAELKPLKGLVLFQTYLDNLDAAQTSDYIQHQLLKVAEAELIPFSERAMSRIHMLTGGSMRLINTLCDFVLFNASLGQIRRITPELVQTTFNALQWEPVMGTIQKAINKTSENVAQSATLTLEYDKGATFLIEKDVVNIGRASDNDICIRNLRVSRYHARITKDDQGMSIEDLGSTNGVYVNEQRVKVCTLSDGDVIAIDQNRMRLSMAKG